MTNNKINIKNWDVNTYSPKPPEKKDVFDTILTEPNKYLINSNPIKVIENDCPSENLSLKVCDIPKESTDIEFCSGSYGSSDCRYSVDINASIAFYNLTPQPNPNYDSELFLFLEQERIFQEQLSLYPSKLKQAQEEREKYNLQCKLNYEKEQAENLIKKELAEKELYLKLKEKYENKK